MNSKSIYYKIGERLFIVFTVIVVTTIIVRAIDNESGGELVENYDSKCPNEMIFITSANGGFCIDKYETSAGDNCKYNDPQSQNDSQVNIEQNECLGISTKGAVPWRFLSQNQAAIVCAKAGKRLPSNKEWLLAAYGTPDINDNWSKNDCQVNNNWSDQPGLTGSGENCVSSFGIFDMIGNVWEWVDGTVSDGKYDDRELPDNGFILAVDDKALPSETSPNNASKYYYNDYFWLNKSGVKGMARGGYWGNKDEAGQYSIYAVSAPNYSGKGVGFRCAK
jgi:sulfatase modifying factor 1